MLGKPRKRPYNIFVRFTFFNIIGFDLFSHIYVSFGGATVGWRMTRLTWCDGGTNLVNDVGINITRGKMTRNASRLSARLMQVCINAHPNKCVNKFETKCENMREPKTSMTTATMIIHKRACQRTQIGHNFLDWQRQRRLHLRWNSLRWSRNCVETKTVVSSTRW